MGGARSLAHIHGVSAGVRADGRDGVRAEPSGRRAIDDTRRTVHRCLNIACRLTLRTQVPNLLLQLLLSDHHARHYLLVLLLRF